MNALYFGSIIYVFGGIILMMRYSLEIISNKYWTSIYTTAALIAAVCTLLITGSIESIVMPTAFSLLIGVLARFSMPRYTLFGLYNLTFTACYLSSLMIFMAAFIHQSQWSKTGEITAYFLLSAATLVTVFNMLWSGIMELPELPLKHLKRNHALQISALQKNKRSPKISIHVPCYKEPPSLVIMTLNALANLSYENYEVIVIDNNTKDDNLWKPVQSHCQKLGKRFKFYHVDPLSGAKAGAMNYALRHTDPAAEIIASVDADYIAHPEFLSSLLPLFSDQNVSFVQSSHDYREWRDNLFLSGVYYFYLRKQKIVHPVMNEFNSANLVGTMCLIRRKMLEEVGGWAEWSLTEDDELSVRLLARGYIGHVFADTWGRGLIPSTFEGIKKQMFRWQAGPIQELQKNWRLHISLVKNSKLSSTQKILRLKRLMGEAAPGFLLAPSLVAISLGAYLAKNDIKIEIPNSVLWFLICAPYMRHIKRWITLKHLKGNSTRNFIMTIMMEKALQWNTATAFFTPLFKLNIPWIRTNKFGKTHSLARAFQASRIEIVLAITHLIFSLILLQNSTFYPIDLIALLSIWLLFQAFTYFCAPLMAIISELELPKEESSFTTAPLPDDVIE